MEPCRRAALVDIQERGLRPQQYERVGLDHGIVQSQISFLSRAAGQALCAYRLVTTHSNRLRLFLRTLRTKDRMWFMRSSTCATHANTNVLKSHVPDVTNNTIFDTHQANLLQTISCRPTILHVWSARLSSM